MPKDHGMIFSGESVRGILADPARKTMTRRIIKLPDWVKDEETSIYMLGKYGGLAKWVDGRPVKRYTRPGGMTGDRIWVKEIWAKHGAAEDKIYKKGDGHQWGTPIYKATFGGGLIPVCEGFTKWKSPMFMPRWASRITLEITGVKIERVQEISEDDCELEGAKWYSGHPLDPTESGTYIVGFKYAWEKIHAKKPENQWAANPWVVAITFKRVEGETSKEGKDA